MNIARVALAAVVATVVDAVYGFVVYGTLLSGEFGRYPNVYRPTDTQMGFMPILFCGIFIAMIGASAIYAKGYEGGSGLMEGFRFGVLIALVATGYAGIVGYSMTNIGRKLGLAVAAANFVEWIIAGVVIGLIYKPAAKAAHRATGV
jgi:hypothetical protein